MTRKIRDLKVDLREAGFVRYSARGKGSYEVWAYRYNAAIAVNVAGHDRDDADQYLEKQVREAIAAARAWEEQTNGSGCLVNRSDP
jgi:hypothetical protein